MARPMAYQDSTGHSTVDLSDFLLLTNKSVTLNANFKGADHDEDSDPVEGWIATPPRPGGADDQESISTLDPLLSMLTGSPSLPLPMPPENSQADSLPHADVDVPVTSASIPGLLQRRRSSTPSLTQASTSKKHPWSCKPDSKTAMPLTNSPDLAHGRDQFGIRAMMAQLPTKAERAESDMEAYLTQERMTDRITETMSSIITSNRALEMANTRELALSENQVKTRIARSAMVVDLIRAGQTPEEARMIAHQELPDP